MFAGTDFNWRAPIRLGDTITAEPRLKELRDLKSAFSGRSILQVYRVVFCNQDDQILCEADSWVIRTQRDVARHRASRQLVHPKVWTPEEIAEVAEHYENYRRRGPQTLYFEDITVGQKLAPMLKGPSTVTSFVCFTQGWGSLYVKAHKQAFEMFRDHPALGIPNDLGVPEPPERVHWDSELARAVGVPAAYDYGPERISWLGQLVTDWMGDDGFLKRLNVQVRRHNIVGDLTTCEGTVTRKWRDSGENLVELAVRGHNQNDEETSVGMAVVALPARN
jgi:acyl dehydratase